MFYELFRIIGLVLAYPAYLLFFKTKTYYEDKKSVNLKKGGKLIVSNHFNIFDYFINCFTVFPRKLFAVTAEMPFKSRWLRFGMKFFGAIQANRVTRDMSFIDKSVAVIEKGKLVQIFPEGRNTPDGNIHEFKRSYIVIAHRAGCPIVPIVTDGNYGFFKRARVIIGKEIDLSPFIKTEDDMPTKEEIETANEYVFQKVLALREQLEELKRERNKK